MSDFKAKMYQIQFRLGLCPRTRWGSLQRSPDLIAGLRGPTSKGRGREGEVEAWKGKRGDGKGRGKLGEGGRDPSPFTPPQSIFFAYAPGYITCQKLTEVCKTCFTTTKETALALSNLAHPVIRDGKSRLLQQKKYLKWTWSLRMPHSIYHFVFVVCSLTMCLAVSYRFWDIQRRIMTCPWNLH